MTLFKMSRNDTILITVLYSVNTPLSFLGNGLFMVVVLHFRKPLSASETCLLQLAFSDTLLAFSHLFFLAEAVNGEFDTVMSCAMNFLNQVAFSACILLLTGVALHQWRSITGPQNKQISRHFLLAQTVATWILALLSSLPDVIVSLEDARKSQGLKSLGIFSFVVQLLLTFLLPVVIMTACYFAVLRTVCQTSIRRRRHVYRMVAALLSVFYIFQLPRVINQFLEFFSLNSWSEVAYILSSFSCAINPIIYAIFWQKFQNNTKNLFAQIKCLKKKSLRPVQNETSSTYQGTEACGNPHGVSPSH